MDRLTADWRDLLALGSALAMIVGTSIVWNIGVGLIVAGVIGLAVAIAAAVLLPHKPADSE